TSFLTIATRARDRCFDLDAARTPSEDTRPRNTNGPKARGHDDPAHMRRYDSRTTNPAGAPPPAWWRSAPGDCAAAHGALRAAPLDWWHTPPGGYEGAHSAVYPEALCARPIEAMCPHRVCTTCGDPSRRIAETTNAVGKATGRRAWRENGSDGVGAGHSGEFVEKVSSAPTAERVTLGW